MTFETCASGGMDLEAIGREITGKKMAIGVIDHHTLQVETPEGGGGAHSPRAQIHSRRAFGNHVRLRNGAEA